MTPMPRLSERSEEELLQEIEALRDIHDEIVEAFCALDHAFFKLRDFHSICVKVHLKNQENTVLKSIFGRVDLIKDICGIKQRERESQGIA